MDRIKVILKSAVTYLVLAATVLGIFNEELANVTYLPDWVGQVLTAVISVIGVAILIIRRVEPVIPARRGIIEPADRGQSTIATAATVTLACVVFALCVVAVRMM